MPTVAERLRAAREARNLTVEQVADLTKIRTDRVRALEAGRFEAFSATVYIRGSVKAYVKALKLNEAEMLAALEAELKGTQKFSEPPPLVEQKRSVFDHFALLVAKLNWKLGFIGVFVILALILGGFGVLAWKHHKQNDPMKTLPPAVYKPSGTGDTLPVPRR